MNSPPGSNPRSRDPGLAGLAALVLGACHSPLGGREIDLALSAQALPGAGAGIALAQRIVDRGDRRIDFELGFEHQEIADEGPKGDDWRRAWGGLRCAAGEPRSHVQGRVGATWIRNEGEPSVLSDAGDYGGLYLGAGWVWELSPSLGMGPDLTVLFVDSEGDDSGSGTVAELAWRWIWHL